MLFDTLQISGENLDETIFDHDSGGLCRYCFCCCGVPKLGAADKQAAVNERHDIQDASIDGSNG